MLGLRSSRVVQFGLGWLSPLIADPVQEARKSHAALPGLRIAFSGASDPDLLAATGGCAACGTPCSPLRYALIGSGPSAVLCPTLVYGWFSAPRLELAGSAVANLAGQLVAGGFFISALLAEKVSLRVDPPVLRADSGWVGTWCLRTAGIFRCASSRPAPWQRDSEPPRWRLPGGAAAVNFLALVLDSLAIAAQSLVGAALSAGRRGGRPLLCG